MTPGTRPKVGEIKLFENTKVSRFYLYSQKGVEFNTFLLQERKCVEDLADLYSIIRATESLEAAYSRDAITPDEYAEACKRLISQFKSTESALVSSKAIVSADKFITEFQVDCPRAYERLIVSGQFLLHDFTPLLRNSFIGVPATVLHAPSDNRAESVVVAETVQAFITAMDALRLQQKAVDEVQVASASFAHLTLFHSFSLLSAVAVGDHELVGEGSDPSCRF
jgi:hypothetical protein